MRDFDNIKFSISDAEKEVAELKALLQNKRILEEKKDIQPFFRARHNLCALVGYLNPNVGVVDLISFELSYFRDFSCDVALGDKVNTAFTLVEFEDASETSVFQKNGKHRTDWSARLEHGHSQILDWLWRLDDWRRTEDFDSTFGNGAQAFTMLLLVGRTHFLDNTMRRRLQWRRENVVIHSKKILIYTYDELLSALETKVSLYRALLSPGKPVPIGSDEG